MTHAYERLDLRGGRGNRIGVMTAGAGPLVVMVHGFPESWRCWRQQIAAVAAAGFTAAALDVRGYGMSDKPDDIEMYTLTELAGDIKAVIEAMSPDAAATLVGHDWGAPQVYTTALLFPDHVRSVVGLSSPPAEFVDKPVTRSFEDTYGDEYYYMRYFQRAGVAEAELEADLARFVRVFLYAMSGSRPDTYNILRGGENRTTLLADIPVPDELPEWLSPDLVDEYVQVLRDGGLAGPLARYRAQDLDVEQLRPYKDRTIDQPALFIGGSRDPARFMVRGIDRYRSPMPRMTDRRGAHQIEAAGHWIQQEAPHQLNALLIPFLQATDAGSRDLREATGDR